MSNVRSLVDRLLQPRSLAAGLFILGLVFQAMLLTKLAALYFIFKVILAGLAVLLIAWVLKAASRQKVLVLVVLAIILVRLPFLVHPTGLMTMSDNALEALQSQEIQDSRTVPFYQFEVLKHQGTWRYLLVAQTFDFVGPRYLVLVLWNLVVFIAIILLLAKLLEPVASRAAVILLSLLSFMFIETMFDFSLLIRGGIYLDALLLALLGMSLFDFEFKRATPLVLSYYFLFFGIYIQPIAALFAAAFIGCTLIVSLQRHRFWRNAALLVVGAVLGSFQLVYYSFFFKAKPVSTGGFEEVSIIPLSRVSWQLVPALFRNFKTALSDLFRYETTYFLDRGVPGGWSGLLAGLNAACLYLSLAVFLAGTGLAVGRLVRGLRKKPRFQARDWPYLFYLLLLLGILVKLVALRPPRLEPRHCLDLLLLIMLSYYFVVSLVIRQWKPGVFKAAAAVIILLVLSVPHYYFFLSNTISKERSYGELMAALRLNKVQNLVTDFNLAYPAYFLSKRKILVSDTMGPLSLGFFYPGIRAQVDALPDADKSFLFYSPAAGTREWHKKATRRLLNETQNRLREEGIAFRVVALDDYTLIVPKKVRLDNAAKGDEP